MEYTDKKSILSFFQKTRSNNSIFCFSKFPFLVSQKRIAIWVDGMYTGLKAIAELNNILIFQTV